MQFYGISFVHPYKHSGRWQDARSQYQAHPVIDQTVYIDARKIYHKIASKKSS